MKTTNCGYVNGTATFQDLTSYTLMIEDEAQKASAAASYAQQCYTANTTNVYDCNYFTISRLPTMLDADAPCPFTADMCRNNSGGNVRFDTGYLNSHDHFGINAPPNERILFRHVMQCAPLNTAGFETNGTGAAENYTRYHYGSNIRWVGGNVTFSNWTYETRNLDLQYNGQQDDPQNAIGLTYKIV